MMKLELIVEDSDGVVYKVNYLLWIVVLLFLLVAILLIHYIRKTDSPEIIHDYSYKSDKKVLGGFRDWLERKLELIRIRLVS